MNKEQMLEQENKRLKDKLASLERENKRAKDENTRLTAEAATRDSIAYIADTSGMARRTIEVVSKLQQKNEELTRDLSEFAEQLYAAHDDAIMALRVNYDELTVSMKLTENTEQKNGLSHISRIILSYYVPIQERATKMVNMLAVERKTMLAKERRIDADVLINEIVAKTRVATLYELEGVVFKLGRKYADDQRVIVSEIIEELHTTKKVNSDTVSRLNLKWATEEINTKLGSHYYLLKALNHAYAYQMSPMTQEDYADLKGITVADLQKWRTILNKMNDLDQSFRNELKEVLK
ncbi:MAG: hypothetical protein H0X30_05590 [Anaerolineae bacterium]|nr:hypothetical protein [Anaerolineae bacterium]